MLGFKWYIKVIINGKKFKLQDIIYTGLFGACINNFFFKF